MSAALRIALVATLLSLGGCVAMNYSLVAPGAVSVEGLELAPATAWNEAPPMLSPASRKASRVWTHDGLLLDRLLIIPAVPDGEPVFRSRDESAALPVFRASMLPNELEELTESSITKLFGEGEAVVETANLRPHRFGDHAGVLFNLDIRVSDSPDYRGVAGAFVAGDRLYLMIFIGAEPHYYDRYAPEAESLIKGARIGAAG